MLDHSRGGEGKRRGRSEVKLRTLDRHGEPSCQSDGLLFTEQASMSASVSCVSVSAILGDVLFYLVGTHIPVFSANGMQRVRRVCLRGCVDVCAICVHVCDLIRHLDDSK